MYAQVQQQQAPVPLHYPVQVQAPPYQQQQNPQQPIGISPILPHPQQQQHPYLYHQHHDRSGYVKAEEMSAMDVRARVYAVAAPRN